MSDWLRANALAILALIISAFALFKERWLARWFGPRLTLCFDRQRGADLHRTDATVTRVSILPSGVQQVEQAIIPAIYVRLQVWNVGRSTAEMVEVGINELQRRDPVTFTYARDDRFLPLNLKWSHTGEDHKERIPRGVMKYCDVLHIMQPGLPLGPTSLGAELDLEVLPATKSAWLAPGMYRLALVVAAANTRARTFTLDLTVPNTLADNVPELLDAGFYLGGLPENV